MLNPKLWIKFGLSASQRMRQNSDKNWVKMVWMKSWSLRSGILMNIPGSLCYLCATATVYYPWVGVWNFLINWLGPVPPGRFGPPAFCWKYICFYYIHLCKKKNRYTVKRSMPVSKDAKGGCLKKKNSMKLNQSHQSQPIHKQLWMRRVLQTPLTRIVTLISKFFVDQVIANP